MRNILSEIRQDLVDKVDQEYKIGATKYFKEEINILGVRIPDVRKIANIYWGVAKDLQRQEIIGLCQRLMDQGWGEEKIIAFDWIFRLGGFTKDDFDWFERLVEKYVTDWSLCDDLSTHAIGAFLEKYPQHIKIIKKKWVKSDNRWLRRSSAVSMIYLIRRCQGLADILEIGEALKKDEDDLVRKGLGWLLREAWTRYPSDVYRYLLENKNQLARVTLRYAVEKMDKSEKKELMERSL